MKYDNINTSDYKWIDDNIKNEYSSLSDIHKSFFDKFRFKKVKLFKLLEPSKYDDCAYVILSYNDSVILFDDIEEYFAVGKMKDKKIYFSGTFTSLSECINNIEKKKSKV